LNNRSKFYITCDRKKRKRKKSHQQFFLSLSTKVTNKVTVLKADNKKRTPYNKVVTQKIKQKKALK